jgi:transcriptional regulator with XRE-family HTH domain
MLKTPLELQADLGKAIRTRRVLKGLSQSEAAKRVGVGLSTWKRMEAGRGGQIENLINAAIALRCEECLAELFPAPAASSIEELLARQAAAAPKLPQRVRRRSTP